MSNFVKLFNAALDDAPDSPTQIVLRGALDISTLKFLRQDIYQRDPQAYASQYNILEALETNQPLPDIELGMRGHEWFSREGDFTLKDPTYIIDGLQRVSTIIEWVERNPDRIPKLGALVHFNTTRAWERERFHALNNYRRRLSPNVLLRNMRETNTAIATLYGLCFNDTKFALFERVSWEQNMRRQEIIPALLLTKIANRLHSHVNTAAPRGTNGPGRGSANIENVASALKNRADLVKLGVLRQNVVEFFDVMDDMWGVRNVQYKDKAHYLKGTFLQTMAKLFSDHEDFWDGHKLFVSLPMRRKIKQFDIDEPFIQRLTGSGGRALDELYEKLLEHVNKGKRTHRLKNRYKDAA